jgi:hypothetical protein
MVLIQNAIFFSLDFSSFVGLLEEDVVVDDVHVELSEDGPVVGHQSDEGSGHLGKFFLTKSQARRNLKWGRSVK